MRNTLSPVAAAIVSTLLAPACFGQASAPSEPSVEQQVLAEMLARPIGPATLAHFGLPDGFARRAADRILCLSYERQYRIVVRDGGAAASAAASAASTSAPAASSRDSTGRVRVIEHRVESRELDRWNALREEWPGNRGFRAFVDGGDEPWPIDTPPAVEQSADALAAQYVAERLARDGVLATTAGALGFLNWPASDAALLTRLRRIGLPLDLLEHFRPPGSDSRKSAAELVSLLFESGRDARGAGAAFLESLAAWRFEFAASIPGFQAGDEAGSERLAGARLQATRGTDFAGVGDGGSCDLIRNLARANPDWEYWISIEKRHADSLRVLAASWSAREVHLIVEPLPVAQWAQDNGKIGIAPVEGGGAANRRVLLAPRFASRGEEASIFVPGENLLLDGLKQAGFSVVHSPLLFQGGNLIVVGQRGGRGRVLLVGEAEISRNVALGLSREQAITALTIEFGVDRCVVLPAASYHIDYEVSVRRVGGKTIALVNDPLAAAREIVSISMQTLARHGIVERSVADAAAAEARAGRDIGLLERVAPVIQERAVGYGQFPESLANLFAAGPADSGVGNFQRFLLAVDVLIALSLSPEQVPPGGEGAYVRALRREATDRLELQRTLRELGWTVALVPSIAAGERSVNYVNGVHGDGLFLMPAWGGLFEPLDQTAKHAIEAALGESVRVIPILCSESQRRDGAVRCAMMPLPTP